MEITAQNQNTEYSDTDNKYTLGFWVYLMTDLVSFAALFATYAVLRNNTYGGPGGAELFNLPFVLGETLILLTSSFTCGMATIAVHQNKKNLSMAWFTATLLLGLAFLGMELSEFLRLLAEQNGPQHSAFLSSFFTLVGTHGLHIAVGSLWLIISIVMVYLKGLTPSVTSKLARLSLFWHFLDVVWIFIFTIVYLLK